jgi:aminomethyltransferase
MNLRATPFHARAAESNRGNDWIARCGCTLARVYTDAADEALAARVRSVLADISWRWRVMIEGARAGEFVSHFLTRDAARLEPGAALKALWLNDGGAVRGAGAIARYGRESFMLVSAAEDRAWLASAASQFGVSLRDVTDGGLALTGPYASAILQEAGLEPTLDPLCFRKVFWRGLDVTISRFGEHGGYEIWCAPDDGVLLWDRLMRAGSAFGLQPAGTLAMDILDLEAGIARPGRDHLPARDGFAAQPSPKSLGLEKLIETTHPNFNGRTAFLAGHETRTLIGLEIDSERPAPHTPVMQNGQKTGHTLSSHYSPALRRAIALAIVEQAAAAPGTELSLTLSPTIDAPEFRNAIARVVKLPFLAVPDRFHP